MVAQEFAVTHPERVECLALACTSAGGDGGPSYPLHKLSELPPKERAAAQLKLADSRWDERWLEAHPADRALAEALAAADRNQRDPAAAAARTAQLRHARAMTYGTASKRSHARPWLATATTTGSRRPRTAPRSHRASAEPSCAATMEGTSSCSRTRPRYRNTRHSFERRPGAEVVPDPGHPCLSSSDRLAAPTDDMRRQICSFCTAEPGTAEPGTAESPATAQMQVRRVRVRLTTATRPRTVIDISLMDRRLKLPRCPVSRLAGSRLHSGADCQMHGDPTYLNAAIADDLRARRQCIFMQAGQPLVRLERG